MFKTIEKLRQKPEGTKKQIAFGIAFAFAGVIFLVWLSVVYPGLKEENNRDEKVNDLEKSPLSGFSETLGDGFKSLSDDLKNIKDSISNFSTEAEYYVATTSTSTQNTATTTGTFDASSTQNSN